jgi:hypothetical protein
VVTRSSVRSYLGADRLGGLDLDELLAHEGHRLAHEVQAAAGADGIERLGQERL